MNYLLLLFFFNLLPSPLSKVEVFLLSVTENPLSVDSADLYSTKGLAQGRSVPSGKDDTSTFRISDIPLMEFPVYNIWQEEPRVEKFYWDKICFFFDNLRKCYNVLEIIKVK